MPSWYVVESARNAGLKQNPHGGQLAKWYLALKDDAGQTFTDVYTQKKPENQISQGERVYGRVEEGEYGLRFFGENPAEAPAPANAPPAQQVVTPKETIDLTPGTPNIDHAAARDRSIILQTCLKVSAMALGPQSGEGATVNAVETKLLALAKKLADEVQAEARRAGGGL